MLKIILYTSCVAPPTDLWTQHTICRNNTNFRDAEPAVWPHPLTFEPFGVDLFDEVGVDVSCYELGLGDDVPQHWDVVVDTCGRGRRDWFWLSILRAVDKHEPRHPCFGMWPCKSCRWRQYLFSHNVKGRKWVEINCVWAYPKAQNKIKILTI